MAGIRLYVMTMRNILRNLMGASAVIAMVLALALPARADNVSGTFRIVTRTGIHMIVTIIQTGDNTIEGVYVGANGVAGHLTGRFTGNASVAYKWVQRQGESSNEQTLSGWGNMNFNDAATGLKTAWGYDGQTQAVGFWTGTLINP
ncbi:MAG: hypothetical protein QOJ39_2505 [Candidatus Eremiobacteraeota bacterium]|nr:hypothetical protein [Candidatus Eremiobacteraeota bacterium]